MLTHVVACDSHCTSHFSRRQPGNVSLEEHDPELFDIIEREKNRQWKSLELIASEVGLQRRGLVTQSSRLKFIRSASRTLRHVLSWSASAAR